MRDDELDHLLATAMQIEHSPEFLPRVRRQVEREAGTSWPVVRWPLALVGTGLIVTAIVAAALVWPRRDSPARVPLYVVSVPKPTAAASASSPVARPGVGSRTPVTPGPMRPTDRPLIAREEIHAMRLLVKRARKGAIPEVLPTDRHVVADDTSLMRLEIPAVAIEPLAGPEQWQEGDRPW